jgi:hypothetical protein
VDELLLYYAPFFVGEGIGMANISPLVALDQRQDWHIFEGQVCDMGECQCMGFDIGR